MRGSGKELSASTYRLSPADITGRWVKNIFSEKCSFKRVTGIILCESSCFSLLCIFSPDVRDGTRVVYNFAVFARFRGYFIAVIFHTEYNSGFILQKAAPRNCKLIIIISIIIYCTLKALYTHTHRSNTHTKAYKTQARKTTHKKLQLHWNSSENLISHK